MTDRYTDYDAAYVLGALSALDRAEYERHLGECADCAAAVRSLAPIPALLGTVPEPLRRDEAIPPPTLLPQLLAEVRRTRVRRRWYASGLAAAVAACLVLVTVLVARSDQPSRGPAVAMHAVVATPVHATAVVQDVAWGTRITLHCTYDVATYPPDIDYSLIAVDRAGAEHALGTWRLVGGVTTFESGTSIHRSDLAQIQVRGSSGTEVHQLQL